MAFGAVSGGGKQDHTYVRSEVDAYRPLWTNVRDCLRGSIWIKGKTTAYLPKPNATDTSAENAARYASYVQRAVFYNVTGRTLRGFVGHVFAKLPTIELPGALEVLRENADGLGVPIGQQAQKVLARLISFGRGGLLADFPTLDTPASRSQIASGEVSPTINFYEPENIINWRVRRIGTRNRLVLVVLIEHREKEDQVFSRDTTTIYRVLTINSQGVYQVETFDDSGVSEGITIPKDSKGVPLEEIPFVFLGSENNDPEPDEPPLYDLSELNIAHYRNSADYEESCYLVGQPTPVVSGLTKDWATDILGGVIQLGSRGVVPLPVGGKAELLQAQPNSMPKEAMEHKEKQMVALGARIVESRSIERTATESGQDEEVETSILINAARNVSLGYEKALRWAGRFVGVTEDAKVELNTDFAMARMTVEERVQLVAEWQSEAITTQEMRRALRTQGTALFDLEEYKKDLQENPPPKEEPPVATGFNAEEGRRAPQPNERGARTENSE